MGRYAGASRPITPAKELCKKQLTSGTQKTRNTQSQKALTGETTTEIDITSLVGRNIKRI